jgi:CheY-like chemotaxis protein
VFALDTLVADLEAILRRLLGERVVLTRDLAAGAEARVRADEGQIEQVVLNLVINARDALADGAGRIGIATSIVHVDARDGELAAGDYVRLRVTDDGCGMTDEVKAHLFEPFFTTKPRGQGTGLGLATVYGIVKQCGGAVTATSAPDAGSAFEVLLPMAEGAASRPPAEAPTAPRGSETVLLVEDEAPLRRLIREVLTESGYDVVEAADGEEALRVCREREAASQRVDLILSDVVMPGMGGRQLAQQVRRTWPGARVLLMSGYDDDAIAGPDAMVLGKPFTAAVLAARVREALDDRAHGAGT